jgi:hypothetical protein
MLPLPTAHLEAQQTNQHIAKNHTMDSVKMESGIVMSVYVSVFRDGSLMLMELAARSLPSLLPNLPLQVQLSILLTSQLAVKNPMTVIVNMGFGVAVTVVVSVIQGWYLGVNGTCSEQSTESPSRSPISIGGDTKAPTKAPSAGTTTTTTTTTAVATTTTTTGLSTSRPTSKSPSSSP